MEINAQKMEALLHAQEQQGQLLRKPNQQVEGFEALLNSQMAEQAMPAPALNNPALTGLGVYPPLLDMGEQPDTSADMAVMQAAMDQAAGTLDMWDDYTRALSGGGATSLRDAYSLLEGIDSQIAALRATPAMGKSATFDGLVNELEILAATEKFKFNRGDYLS